MKTHKLELNDNELNIVLAGLQKLPWEASNAIIQKIVADLKSKETTKDKK